MERVIRVLLVDDDATAMQGLKRMLGGKGNVEIVGVCASATEARSQVIRLRPEVVLTGVAFP